LLTFGLAIVLFTAKPKFVKCFIISST
jgi:hypothetical protein